MSKQYDNYLESHIGSVEKGFEWLRENLPDLVKDPLIEECINFHDQTKTWPDEYKAYDRYFYGGNKSYQVVQDFRIAWLTHIHRSPHHWQYWVLINDDPGEGMVILDMPYHRIVEMICDWWTFSWRKDDLTEIFSWYDQHKDYMKLSDYTRKTVEDILGKIKDKLEEQNA